MTVSLTPAPLPQAGEGRFVSRWRDFHGTPVSIPPGQAILVVFLLHAIPHRLKRSPVPCCARKCFHPVWPSLCSWRQRPSSVRSSWRRSTFSPVGR